MARVCARVDLVTLQELRAYYKALYHRQRRQSEWVETQTQAV